MLHRIVLRRVYAYAVEPQKGFENPSPPRGGALTDLQTLGTVVQDATQQVRPARWINVRLNVLRDGTARTSAIRDAALNLAFGRADDANVAAADLATRLSTSMDRRSRGGCLLVLAVTASNDAKQVTLWTFPRDAALQFSTSQSGPNVTVLQDAFSRESHLRKAAVMSGPANDRTTFLTARVADLQSGGGGQAADYWLHDFLDAELSLSSHVGSAALGRALKAAWENSKTDSERDQFYAASVAVRTGARTRWSLSSFATEFLRDEAKAGFLRTREAREHRAEQFDLDREAFDRVVNFRILRLDNGVRISAPFAEADSLLDFEKTADGTKVTASGLVRDDRVSQRG